MNKLAFQMIYKIIKKITFFNSIMNQTRFHNNWDLKINKDNN